MNGYNAFLTNSDENFYANKTDTTKYRDTMAKNLYKYGIIKKPGSAYYIEKFASKNIDHCIITGQGLALCINEYNQYLNNVVEDKYTKQVWKIDASPEMISKTPTESWVFRNM